MRFALTAYSLAHVTGYLPTRDGRPCAEPLDAAGLMDAVAEMGLDAVEIPLPATDPQAVGPLGAALRERGLGVVTDYLVIDERGDESFLQFLRASARLGAKVVRATMSGILCGDRRTLPGGWPARLDAVARTLRDVLPEAHDLGLCVTLENHQDATADDFLELADRVDGHPAFGVCLDTGNPLAVGEGPVETARRLAPLIRHAHLKDYTMHFCPEGYRLVRCAAGRGVIDFAAILDVLSQNGHEVLPGIEVAWQATRTIPVFDQAWWAHYPSRDVTKLLPALRLLWEKGRPASEPYSSAWERGESSGAVCAEEWDVLRRSVEYFKENFSGGGSDFEDGAGHVPARRPAGAGDRGL
jgi:sugar phosphate isomerase/epimerase